MVFDVRDFGAEGDGATDDTAALAAAISAAQTAGGVVYLSAGTYRTTAGLAVNPRRVVLRGDGPQCTTIAAQGTGYALTLGWDNTEPVYRGPVTALEGISLTGTGDGLALQGPPITGHAHAVTVRDVCFDGFGTQVDIGPRTYLVRFDRVFFSKAAAFGVRLANVSEAGENISFDGCVFSDTPGTAVYVDKSGSSLYFTHCSFDYLGRALWQRAGVVNFTACHFEAGTTFGGPGKEMLLLARRGSVELPLLTLADCDFYDAWTNYDTCIRLAGDSGGDGLRLVNPRVRVSSPGCPYLVRDDSVTGRGNIVVSGAWYGRGDYPAPKLRRRDGTELVLTTTVTHMVT